MALATVRCLVITASVMPGKVQSFWFLTALRMVGTNEEAKDYWWYMVDSALVLMKT